MKTTKQKVQRFFLCNFDARRVNIDFIYTTESHTLQYWIYFYEQYE